MMSNPIDPGSGDASVTQTQLDALVVTIELTLISIVQGVALSFLADHARDVPARSAIRSTTSPG